jgi:phosphoglycerate dehydrogenase-like enzyme
MTTVITKRLGYLETAERLLGPLGPVEYCEDQKPETVRKHLPDARVIVATKGVTVDGDVLDAAPDLRIVAAPTAGYDWIDVGAATARGIPVIANTGAAADAVAEFTLGVVLALTRRIAEADRLLHQGRDWTATRDEFAVSDRRIGIELGSSTVGIVGLGHVGLKVAEKLAVLRPAAIIGYDPVISAGRAAEAGVELCPDARSCAERADLLLLHVPLTPATTGLVDAALLSAMRPTSYLVNCSRGRVVSEPDLIDALRRGRLAGAALDVFEDEPLPAGSPLRQLGHVLLTPHIAGVTAQSDENRAREIASRVLACAAGIRPSGLVNPLVWETRRQFSDR